MSETKQETESKGTVRIGLDTWAVLLGLALVALVRLGWLPKINW